jgi:PAS domain S-box-containing protein
VITVTLLLLTALIGLLCWLVKTQRTESGHLRGDLEIKDHRLSQALFEKNKLQSILANMREGIVFLDENKRIAYHNNAALQIFGITAGTYIGTTLDSVLGFETVDRWLAGLENAKDYTGSEETEFKLYIGGVKKLIAVQAIRFGQGQESSNITISIKDLTKSYQVEKMRRDFVANVSHELKTPLTAVRGYTETLMDGAKSDPAMLDRFLQKIKTNGDRLHELVNDILGLAKLESDESPDPIVPVSIKPSIEKVVLEFENLIEQKSFVIDYKLESDPVVLAHSKGIENIYRNLLSNALRYTPDGGKITIHLRTKQGVGVLAVEDNGVGIPSTKIPRVFERFYLVDKARSGELGGTGLGLSIVKNLCSQFDGSVYVESEYGKGSKFTVELPLAPSEA